MWTVEDIQSPDERRAICKAIIAALPNWFGIEEANASYIEGVASEDCLIVRGSDDAPLGMLSLKTPFPNNADIYWLAVLPDHHHKGIGKALAKAAFERARAKGCDTITVETLGPSSPDEGYARTRAFYEAMGFRPMFEVTPYGPQNPLLYMIRAL